MLELKLLQLDYLNLKHSLKFLAVRLASYVHMYIHSYIHGT